MLGLLAASLIAAPPATGAGLKKNSVRSKQIKDQQVKTRDFALGAVDGTTVLDGALSGFDIAQNSIRGSEINEATLDFSILQPRLTGTCPAGQAVQSIGPTGALECGGSLGSGVTGAVGGDLTGSLPNPSIANGAVNSLKVLNDSLTAADVASNALNGATIDEDTLAKVPDANLLDGINSADFLLDSEATGFLTGASNATGDLAGSTFGNLQLGGNSVGSLEVGPNALTGSDLDESTLGIVPNADQLDGVDYAAIDSRLDALCAQADTVNQEVRDLRSALDIPALTGGAIGLDLSTVNLPDFDPAPCQG